MFTLSGARARQRATIAGRAGRAILINCQPAAGPGPTRPSHYRRIMVMTVIAAGFGVLPPPPQQAGRGGTTTMTSLLVRVTRFRRQPAPCPAALALVGRRMTAFCVIFVLSAVSVAAGPSPGRGGIGAPDRHAGRAAQAGRTGRPPADSPCRGGLSNCHLGGSEQQPRPGTAPRDFINITRDTPSRVASYHRVRAESGVWQCDVTAGPPAGAHTTYTPGRPSVRCCSHNN